MRKRQVVNGDATFFRQARFNHADVRYAGKRGRVVARPRELHEFVEQLGAGFRLRELPSWGWILVLLTLIVSAATWSGTMLPLMAVAVVLICGWLMPSRKHLQRTLPICCGVALLMVLGWRGEMIEPPWQILLCWAVIASAVALLGANLLRVIYVSKRLQRFADGLDDASMLALLPREVAVDARDWLAGEDGRRNDLALVIHLAVLHAAKHQCDQGRVTARQVVSG